MQKARRSLGQKTEVMDNEKEIYHYYTDFNCRSNLCWGLLIL